MFIFAEVCMNLRAELFQGHVFMGQELLHSDYITMPVGADTLKCNKHFTATFLKRLQESGCLKIHHEDDNNKMNRSFIGNCDKAQ